MLPLEDFTFETPTVDRRGQVIERRSLSARRFFENLGGGVRLEMVAVPAGMFWMGSPNGVGYDDERPRHLVIMPEFLIGRGLVTQAQWQALMGGLPPCRCLGLDLPVDRASWKDGQDFCRRLSQKTGRSYHLPSESGWEYACRAGSASAFSFGPTLTTDLANYVGEHTYLEEPKGVYLHVTAPAGSYPPNAYGLYDMHGGLWEACADAWHEDYTGAPPDGSAWEDHRAVYRVGRGGSWHETPGNCRSAARLRIHAQEGEDFYGLRVALDF